MGGRQPEDGHHGVADELLDRAAMARHAVASDRVVASEQAAHLFGVELLAERGRARQVGEQDSDNPAFFGRDGHRNR